MTQAFINILSTKFYLVKILSHQKFVLYSTFNSSYVHMHLVTLPFCFRFAANLVHYGGVLLATSLFQHNQHCGEEMCSVIENI